MEKNRLSKILAASGVASRRKCEEIIFDKRVKVNGQTIILPQTQVDPSIDKIFIDDKPLNDVQEKVYLIMHKPRGYTCTHEKVRGKKIIYDLLKNYDERLFSIGRLDRDTSGLLLFTNDGHFANTVIHPSNNITKEYLVKTLESVTDIHLKTISQGIKIEGKLIRPVRVKKMRRETLKISVKEGKKHEVRLLIKEAGLTLRELKRIRIGGLLLSDLKEGEHRPLTENEKKQIFS